MTEFKYMVFTILTFPVWTRLAVGPSTWHTFLRRYCQTVIFTQYQIFSRLLAVNYALNEVADAVSEIGWKYAYPENFKGYVAP